jgi:hypothetical protein
MFGMEIVHASCISLLFMLIREVLYGQEEFPLHKIPIEDILHNGAVV